MWLTQLALYCMKQLGVTISARIYLMESASKKKIPKKVIFKILASVILIGGACAYYFISNKDGEVLSWMSSSWAYRRGIAVANAGATELTNEDVLIEIDTATLVGASKMQSDCDDLRVTDSDTTTSIDYWIESGCNTATTRVWVRIPTLPADGTTIYFYYGNASAVNAETRWPIYMSFGDGADGDITIGANTNINTATSISGRSCTDGGDAVNYSITAFGGSTATTATLSATPSSGCLSAGDEVLIINLQGISTAYSNVGNYEIMVIDSISTNTITFTTLKTKYYGDGSTDDTNIGTATTNQRVMLQRIPNYNDVTVSSGYSFYPSAWDGTKGGVMMFKANGTVTVNGTIHANALGYRGGVGGNAYSPQQGIGGESFCSLLGGGTGGPTVGTNGLCGGGGGGYATSSNGYAGGSGSATGGAGGGGGGAAYSGTPYGGGGAGAGYGTYGYFGASKSSGHEGTNGGTNISGNGGSGTVNYAGGGAGGGGVYGLTDLSKLYLGSGAGGGGAGNWYGGAGGEGASIVFLQANIISVNSSTGIISSNGETGVGGSYGGGGGGGSGGSIKIIGETIVLNTSRVIASGGLGGDSTSAGDGGDGGDGIIAVEYITSLSGTTSPAASTQQLSLQTTDIQSEELYNQTPTAPTNLYTEGTTNPTRVIDVTPEFSAIYNDPDTSDTSGYYEIEVNTASDFSGTVKWDSTKTSMTSTTQGNRSPNISYAGTTLSLNGTTYYWRIKFWDSANAESPWSSTGEFRMNTTPGAPTLSYTEGTTNPTKVTDLTPEFSAIFNDADTGDTGEYYQLAVDTSPTFDGTSMWFQGKTSMTSTPSGSRSQDISYNGEILALNGTTYYWMIKFFDNNGSDSTWTGWVEDVSYFTMSGPPIASSLLTDNLTNPTLLASASPKFSAICTDPNGDNCSAYEIDIDTLNTFDGTQLWNTGKTSMTITSGSRSSDITYHGTPLTNSQNIYYWRIRFWDTDDTVGEWSSTAQFTDFYPSFQFEGLGLEGIQIN